MGISVAMESVQVYSVYRNDKINDSANLVKFRGQMHWQQQGGLETCVDGNDETVVLDFGGK